LKDDKIIDLYVSRNELAIDETARKYGNYCFTISHNILHNEGDASECVNDAYLKVWEAIPPEIPTYFKSFLGRIVRNLSLDRYRFTHRKKRDSEMEVLLSELEECVSTGVQSQLDHNFTAQIISSWLLTKEEEKKALFVKRYWHVRSIKELADDYGLSESKVKSALFRMRKELKNHLQEEGITL